MRVCNLYLLIEIKLKFAQYKVDYGSNFAIDGDDDDRSVLVCHFICCSQRRPGKWIWFKVDNWGRWGGVEIPKSEGVESFKFHSNRSRDLRLSIKFISVAIKCFV